MTSKEILDAADARYAAGEITYAELKVIYTQTPRDGEPALSVEVIGGTRASRWPFYLAVLVAFVMVSSK